MKPRVRTSLACLAPLFLAALLPQTASASVGKNLIMNGDFEKGVESWQLLLGKDAADSGATLTADNRNAYSGLGSLKLFSPVITRFSCGPHLAAGGKVKPGERYRLSAWVRAGEDFVQQPGSVGFVVRVNLRSPERVDSPDGHYYFALSGRGMRAPYEVPRSVLGTAPVSREWKNLEVVFDIPEGVGLIGFNFFAESGSGSIFVDDVTLEIAGPEEVPTALIDPKRPAAR